MFRCFLVAVLISTCSWVLALPPPPPMALGPEDGRHSLLPPPPPPEPLPELDRGLCAREPERRIGMNELYAFMSDGLERFAPDAERYGVNFVEPTIVAHVWPKLSPKVWMRAGAEAEVKVIALFDEHGVAKAAKVMCSTSSELDLAAIEAALATQVRPATLGGKPSPSFLQIVFSSPLAELGE